MKGKSEIVVIGHIDHGKCVSLLQCGIKEVERGITIVDDQFSAPPTQIINPYNLIERNEGPYLSGKELRKIRRKNQRKINK